LEPKRTNRLLDGLFVPMPANASDTLDGFGFSLMLRASGASASGTAFELVILEAQILISALNGFGAGRQFAPQSSASLAHLLVVLTLQLGTSAWILYTSASNDRMVSLVIAMQFALEASQTALLVIFSFSRLPALEHASLGLALCALAAPIALQFYDLSLVQIDKIMRGGFSCKSVLHLLVGLLVLLPKLVLRLFGIELGDHADSLNAAEKAGADVQKHSEAMGAQKLSEESERKGTEKPEKHLSWSSNVNEPTQLKALRASASSPALRTSTEKPGLLRTLTSKPALRASSSRPALRSTKRLQIGAEGLVVTHKEVIIHKAPDSWHSADQYSRSRSDQWSHLEQKLARARASKVTMIPMGLPPGRDEVASDPDGDQDTRLTAASRGSVEVSAFVRTKSSRLVLQSCVPDTSEKPEASSSRTDVSAFVRSRSSNLLLSTCLPDAIAKTDASRNKLVSDKTRKELGI